MSQKNPKKMIALFISIAAHAALIYYLGKIALDYALPEGTVSSYEINYESPEGQQLENLNVDVINTPPPAVQPAVTEPAPVAKPAEATPEPKAEPVAKPTAVATALPAKEAVAVTEEPSAPPIAVEEPEAPALDENFLAKTPDAGVPAVDPFAEDVDKRTLENAAEAGTELAPPTQEAPAVADAPAEASGADTTNKAYGRPEGVQSDAVLTPVAGNKSISYPTMARFRKLEGETIVHYTVSGDGAVTEVKLVKSSGHDILDDSVIETVKGWKFKPTGQEGVYERPVKFSLKGDAVPAPSKLRRQ